MNEVDNFRDDEFRVLGHHENQSPVPGEPTRRTKLAVGIVSALLVIVIGILAIVFWPKEKAISPSNSSSGNTVTRQRAETASKYMPTNSAETKAPYTEKIDTTVNGLSISIYIPHNATAELMVGKPNKAEKDIILIAQAADIRGDNYKILGAFVLKGEPLSWGRSKKGYCAIIDGEITVGTSDNSPLFEKATETEGYFFRQFPMVTNGVVAETAQHNETRRKALCSRKGQVFIAATAEPAYFDDFAQSLAALGVDNAISLVGSSTAYGWYINAAGEQIRFGEDIHKYENENYILWKLNE